MGQQHTTKRLLKLRRSGWQLGFLATLVAIVLTLTNCRSASNPTHVGTASSPGILVYGSGGQPVNLESGNITDGNSVVVQNQIYNRLIEFKPGSTDLVPGLATSWTASSDGKTWTFKLRPSVKFHDGTEFDAAAVKFNIDRWWDKDNPFGYRNAGKTYDIWNQTFGGTKGEPNSLLQNILVLDKSTLQFVLKQPFAAFPSAIAAGFLALPAPQPSKKPPQPMERQQVGQSAREHSYSKNGKQAIALC